MSSVILRIENLTKYYGQKLVLKIPQLEFEEGKIYALVGPNGSGKTTLLNLLNLLETPSEGKIFFEGQEITNSGASSLHSRRQITMVMQHPLLFRTTVFKNVAYGLRVRSLDKKIRQQRVTEALMMVGLSGFENRKAYDLSAGEAQRVAIARALVLNPKILLLDEPTANIDRNHTEVIERLIKEVNRKDHTTIILTTHSFSQAYRLADKVIPLVNGMLLDTIPENHFCGDVEEVNGQKWVLVSPSVKVNVITEKTGRIHILIDPENIILSTTQLQSSARNSFRGRITKTVAEGHQVRVFLDAGVEFVALITKKSFEEMKLNLGSEVYLTFKTSAVEVL